MNEDTPNNVVTLPYGNPPTSGHAGSETSRERAVNQDANGTTKHRQRETINYVREQGEHGATWKEVADALGMHHGSASGALSNLHKAGFLRRLSLVRNRCKVYVHPAYVGGRTTEAPGRTEMRALLDEMALVVHKFEEDKRCNHLPNMIGLDCLACDARELLRHYNSISGTHL